MTLERALELIKTCKPEENAVISFGANGTVIPVAEAISDYWLVKREVTDPEMIKICKEAADLLRGGY